MKNNYFIHKLILYFVLLAFPIILLGTAFYYYSNYSIKKDINKRAENTFILSSKYLEQIFDTGREQTTLFNNSAALTLSLHKILTGQPMEYNDYTVQNAVFSILENLNATVDFVDSAYIYLDNNKGNYFQSGKKTVNISDSHDQEWLKIYKASDPDIDSWIVKRSTRDYSFEPEKESISIFRRLNSTKGVLVFNLNIKSLINRLDFLQTYDSENIVVTDAGGIPLFFNSTASNLHISMNKSIDSQFSHVNSLNNELLSHVTLNGDKYILTEIISDQYGLRYLSLVKETVIYDSLHQIILFVLMSILFVFILCLIISYRITHKNFQHIQYILDILWKAEKGIYKLNDFKSPTFKDEYDLILNNLINTFISNNTLHMQLKESQISKQSAELAALQLQINPHFFFNTLQTINLEITKNEGFDAPACTLTHNLSDILRYALGDPNKPVSIRDEIEQCKYYINIQKFNYAEKFFLLWDYEDSILHYSIIRLLLQPLIENSLYHGIKQKEASSIIRIKIVEHHEYMYFSILDNGIGIEREQLLELKESLNTDSEQSSHSHIGLKNTHKRLILSYPGNTGLKIISHYGWGTCVTFSIPKTTMADMIPVIPDFRSLEM